MKTKTFILTIILGHFLTSGAQAQKNLNEMSLEELMNVKVSVASNKDSTTRNSPGIISVITEEDIHHSGARDLTDLLMAVPGFSFASDVQGVVGLGFRGHWGQEGKILLIIDGQEMNDTLYAANNFGNNYPINLIHKIEIIRGPGSAIFGGNAELAVIKITTKTNDELNNGAFGVITYGQTDRTFARRNLELGFSKKQGTWKYSGVGKIGQGQRSDRTYTDSAGASYSMQSNSNLNPIFLDLLAKNEDFQARLLYDAFHTTDRSAFDVNLSAPTETNFTNLSTDLQYKLNIGNQFSITPNFSFRYHQPYKNTDPVANEVADLFSDITSTRTKFKITTSYDFNDRMNLISGIEAFKDSAIDHVNTFSNGSKSVQYYNGSIFSQFSAETEVVNFVIGARFEDNSAFDSAFVPRLSLMKQINSFHSKLLYSKAFRSPSIQNINYAAGSIKPENTSVAEVEFGNQFSDHFYASTNFYKIAIDQPIVYDFSGGDSYSNYSHSGTRGFEIDGKYKDSWGYTQFNYSYYQANGNDVDSLSVPGVEGTHLALPTSKATLSANLNMLGENYWINPALVFVGSRYGYDFDQNTSAMALKKFDPTWLANLFFEKRNFLVPQLDLGLGVFNILNQDFKLIQAYNGGHTPLPGSSREYTVRLNYGMNL